MAVPAQCNTTRHANGRFSSFVRQVNVAIRDLNRRLGATDEYRLLCECGWRGCTERVDVPAAVYDTVLDTESRVLAPRHASREAGVVAHAVYAIVAPT